MSDAAWLDVQGAAARVVASAPTILRAARSGALKGYRLAGRKAWRFRPADVDAWMISANTPTPASAPRQQAVRS